MAGVKFSTTGAYPSASQIDAEVAGAKDDIFRMMTASEMATNLLSKATLDSLGLVFCANAELMQRSKKACSAWSERQTAWLHISAKKIKDTHEGASHFLNMGAGGAQLLVSGICMFAQFKTHNDRALSAAAQRMQLKVIHAWQTTGSQVGNMGAVGHNYFDSAAQGLRAELQSHQQMLNSDHQQSTQSEANDQQKVQDALRKAGEADQARHQAFGEVARG